MTTDSFRYWEYPICKFYRFTPHTRDILQNLRIHLSSPVAFNDPFEGLNDKLPFLQHDTLVTCFTGLKRPDGSVSDTLFNPLMWSHYADRHRGFCVVFDPLIAGLFPVQYSGHRPTGYDYHKTITSKGDAWAYENEYRFIGSKTPSNLGRIEYDNGEYYLKFYPDDIKAIIFGCRAEDSNISTFMNYFFSFAMEREKGERPIKAISIKTLSMRSDRFELMASDSFALAKTSDPKGQRSPQWTLLPDIDANPDEEGSINDIIRISPLNKPSSRPETPDGMKYTDA